MLTLERFREILGYHPYHFWQIADTSEALRVNSKCNTIVREYAWMNADSVGRKEIKEAIRVAEHRLFEYLGFRVGKTYVTKILQYPRPYDARMEYSWPRGADGRMLNVNVREGYVRAVGVETRDSIEAGSAVVYSDANGDGIDDTFTVTVATTVTDPDEIALYFVTADRYGNTALSEDWRILPVNVSISGGTATITGPSWIMVRPIAYQGLTQNEISPDTSVVTVFAQTVDVYRRYTTTAGITTDTSQAVLVWESDAPSWACFCNGDGLTFDTNRYDPAAEAYAIARVGIRHGRNGEVTPIESVYNSTTEMFTGINWSGCKQPDRVIIRYLAGADSNEVNSQIPDGGYWDAIVARLAMAELSKRICACDTANQELYRWQFDLSRSAGANDEQYRISDEDLNNPLGTRAGAVYAWKQIKNLRLTRAFVIA